MRVSTLAGVPIPANSTIWSAKSSVMMPFREPWHRAVRAGARRTAEEREVDVPWWWMLRMDA
jgi:hypothetical protein